MHENLEHSLEPNEQNSENGFQKITSESEKTSWADHLRKAKDLLTRRSKAETKEQEPQSEYYLLSEHMNQELTPFGKTAGKSRSEIKAANKWWQGVCENWDKNVGVNMPRELGEEIQKVIDDPNYCFGVHRSYVIDGENFQSDEVLHSILTDGLAVLGDASSGAVYNDPPVSKTVAFCPDMLHAVINTKSSYKNSTGAVLVKIPKEYVDQSGNIKAGMVNKVYDHNELGNSYLKPEFIMGFAQNLGRGTTMKYETRDKILKEYQDAKSAEN